MMTDDRKRAAEGRPGRHSARNLLCSVLAGLIIGCDSSAPPPPVEPQPYPDPDPIPVSAWLITSFPSDETIQAILADDSAFVLVGTWGDGLFRSTDNGLSWEVLAEDVSNDILSITRTYEETILLGADIGIYRSTDSGDSWTKTLNESLVRYVWGETNEEILAVATYGGIYHSTDDGVSWSALAPTPDDRYISTINSVGGNLFVGTFSGIFRSTDGGTSWSKTLSGIACYSMAIGPDGMIFAPTASKFYRSMDEGATWTMGGSTPPIGTVAVSPTGLVFLGTNNDGVFVSDDSGENWFEVSSGLSSLEIRSIAIDPDGYVYAGTWVGGGLFKTRQPIGKQEP